MEPDRWLAVGLSDHEQADRAGEMAAAGALQDRGIPRADPKLLVVFASDAYDLEALLAAIRRSAGDDAADRLLDRRRDRHRGPGRRGRRRASRSAARASRSRPRSRRRLAAACARPARRRRTASTSVETRPHEVLLLLTDGLAGDQQEIVRGAYSVVGAGVPLVGGCAGDDLKMDATFQLHGDQVLQRRRRRRRHRLRRAARDRRAPRLAHGRRADARDRAAPATASSSSTTGPRSTSTSTASTRPRTRAPTRPRSRASPLTHPLGLEPPQRRGARALRRRGRLRRPLARLHRRGAAGRPGLVHGGRRRLGAGGDRRGLRRRARRARRPPPLGVLAFDCIARRGVLGDDGITHRGRRASAEHAGGAPVAGFYTYGEIARTRGVSGFHNQTLVVLAVA